VLFGIPPILHNLKVWGKVNLYCLISWLNGFYKHLTPNINMDISNLEQVVSVNNQLAILYGKHTIKNLPNFRMVYAGEQ